MEDLFYFSKSNITLEDLRDVATVNGYRTEYFTYPNSVRALRTFYSPRWFWEWIKLNHEQDDLEGFEPSALELITKYQPLSTIIIEHHTDSALPQLLGFLKSILVQYGGWVGCDTDNLEPIHTADDIENMRCP